MQGPGENGVASCDAQNIQPNIVGALPAVTRKAVAESPEPGNQTEAADFKARETPITGEDIISASSEVSPSKAVSVEVNPTDVQASRTVQGKKKRKNKKKKKSNSSRSDGASDDSLGDQVSDVVDGATDPEAAEIWRAKAKQQSSHAQMLQENVRKLEGLLSDAIQRASDAEEAEKLVNAGLKTASARLAERERTLQGLTANNSTLRAENNTLTEEKRKLEKRLALMKTLGANLTEAKEVASENGRRLEEAVSVNAKLKQANAETMAALVKAEARAAVVPSLEEQLAVSAVTVGELDGALRSLETAKRQEAEQNEMLKAREEEVRKVREDLTLMMAEAQNAKASPALMAGVAVASAAGALALSALLRAMKSKGEDDE